MSSTFGQQQDSASLCRNCRCDYYHHYDSDCCHVKFFISKMVTAPIVIVVVIFVCCHCDDSQYHCSPHQYA